MSSPYDIPGPYDGPQNPYAGGPRNPGQGTPLPSAPQAPGPQNPGPQNSGWQGPGQYGPGGPNPYQGAPPGYGPPQQGYGYPAPPPRPYGPHPGYPGPPAGMGPPGPPRPPGEPNQLALASVALGFISIVGSVICYGWVLGPVSIGLGVAGVARAKRTGVGRNQSIGGIVLGTIGTAIMTTAVTLFLVYRKKTMIP